MRGADNRIHPTVIISDAVIISDRNVVGLYTLISGPAIIGSDYWIGPSVVIGTPVEIHGVEYRVSWDDGSGGTVRIGDRNQIREFVTVQVAENTDTVIGSDCYLMTKSHVAHDVVVSDQVTISCGVLIGVHCLIGEGSNVGLSATIHHFTAVGAGCMVGMGSVVTRHVLPFSKTYGSPARRNGVNVRGASRLGLSWSDVAVLTEVYAQDGFDLASLPVSDSAQRYLRDWREMQSGVARLRPPA